MPQRSRTMTPELKAKELVNKFIPYAMSQQFAERCAWICLNEIIESLKAAGHPLENDVLNPIVGWLAVLGNLEGNSKFL